MFLHLKPVQFYLVFSIRFSCFWLQSEDTSHKIGQCTQLRYARTTAASRPELDEHGLVGFFCPHGFPLRGMAMPMVTAERFSYYIPPLVKLCTERDLTFFGVDTACQMRPTLTREKNTRLDELTLVTGELHGSTHVLSCQV